ncbi:MAG: HAD family phosphatase [Candidatus Omnitrophica bacterium]|nr:HAD family phosphatase [Candidatus Omnitrophota bacterium]MCB9722185.1 HAD family phosphatase [Candidatus Omnitrophota bacterium]
MPTTPLYVDAVIFDMDGVITHTMPDHHRAWREVLASYDIRVTHHDIYSREGQPGDEALVEIYQKYNVRYAPEDITRVLAEKEAHFKENVRQRFVRGARTFLKSLHRDGFRLALVTGTARHELQMILPARLAGLFDVIITGDDVQRGKPDPEPFVRALRQLGLPADEAIVIENAPYGIRAAKAAGLRCFALETSLSREYLGEADEVFATINDLTRKIQFRRCHEKP